MGGDQFAVLQDVDRAGKRLDLDDTPPGAVGHGVEIAADRDHAVARDPAVERQDGVEGTSRQNLKMWLLLGEVLGDDPAGGGMPAGVGDAVQPLPELCVQVLQATERPAEEEVLADVAEGALDLALGLGAVGLAGLGHETVVRRQVQEFGVVDDAALVDLAQHGGLHAVVQDLRRDAAQRLEGGDMAAQHRRQILALDEAGPYQAAVAEHQGEQPDDPLRFGLIGEGGPEVGEVDLGLFARRGLEAALEWRRGGGPDGAQEVLQRGVAAGIAALLDLPEQAAAVEIGKGGDPLAQIGFDRGEDGRPRITRAIAGRLQAALDVLGDRSAIHPGAPGDRREGEALSMKIQDHYEFPECDHRRLPSSSDWKDGARWSDLSSRYSGGRKVGSLAGFYFARSVEYSPGVYSPGAHPHDAQDAAELRVRGGVERRGSAGGYALSGPASDAGARAAALLDRRRKRHAQEGQALGRRGTAVLRRGGQGRQLPSPGQPVGRQRGRLPAPRRAALPARGVGG